MSGITQRKRPGRRAVARVLGAAALLVSATACEEARGVDVQPLPSLKRPSPEARMGLPEVAGAWRFAGWELPLADTVTRGEGLMPPGVFLVKTQRLDSVAGAYVRDGQEFPFVGEVRRDGVFSVAAFGSDGSGSFVAGRIRKDTLWVELTSLSVAAGWSTGTRAAMVRGRVGAPFVRFLGGWVPPRPDSVIQDSIRRVDSLRIADSLRRVAPGGVPAVVVPGQVQPGVVPVQPGVAPGAAPQRQPPAAQRPRAETGTEPRPKRTPERPPRRQPPPEDTVPRREQEPEPEPERPPPAEPRPDTTARPRPVIVP